MDEILRLRQEGLSQKAIAEALGLSYGKVKYHLAKHGPPKGRQQSEYAITEQEAAAAAEAIVYDFVRERAAADRLVVLPKDASTLYVYWTFTERRKRMAEQHFHCEWRELPKILRVYDVTYTIFNGNNANHYRDIRIDDGADNWFVHGLSAGTVFCVDYGTTALDGKFVAVLRSNTAETPAAHARLRS